MGGVSYGLYRDVDQRGRDFVGQSHGGRRIAAVVVAFHPQADDIQAWGDLAEEFADVIVADNTADGGRRPSGRVRWVEMGRNSGVGAALNAGLLEAARAGATDAVLLDQDSRLSPGFASRMLEFRDRIGQDAIVTPDHRDPGGHPPPSHAFLESGRIVYRACRLDDGPQAAAWTITSGTLIGLGLYGRLGPFREEFFIDHVDTDYCLRARTAGVPVMVNCGERIVHPIGQQELRRFAGVTLRVSHHSATRRYTMARNGVRLAREYGRSFPEIRRHTRRWVVRDVAKILLYETEKAAKLSAILRGWVDA